MSYPRSAAPLAAGAALVAVACLGCGPSEEEYRAKVNEVGSLRGQLAAEQAQSKKTRSDLEAAGARIDQLKAQLAAAGVDVSNLGSSVEQQARALEDYRRRADQLEQMKKRFDLLRDRLKDLSRLGLSVTTRRSRVVIELPFDALFEPKGDALKKEGRDLLLKVAGVIRSDAGLASRAFQVAGHTDGSPVKSSPFRDAWGVSAMRAREVLTFLVLGADKGGGGLDPAKWSAAGHGDADPLRPNDTPEGKAANRRCELILLPSADEVVDLGALTAGGPRP